MPGADILQALPTLCPSLRLHTCVCELSLGFLKLANWSRLWILVAGLLGQGLAGPPGLPPVPGIPLCPLPAHTTQRGSEQEQRPADFARVGDWHFLPVLGTSPCGTCTIPRLRAPPPEQVWRNPTDVWVLRCRTGCSEGRTCCHPHSDGEAQACTCHRLHLHQVAEARPLRLCPLHLQPVLGQHCQPQVAAC